MRRALPSALRITGAMRPPAEIDGDAHVTSQTTRSPSTLALRWGTDRVAERAR
jgi:hypothetical protein